MVAPASNRLWVATRKGLFQLARSASTFAIERVSFLGDVVTLSLVDPRDGAIYAALGLGHFGVKLMRSRDDGATWQKLAAPAYPKQPEGTVDKFQDGRDWPWRVEQIWALEVGVRPGELWCGTIPGGLFHSTDHGESWELVRGLWDHPERKKWMGGGADYPGIHSICVEPSGALTVGVSCGGVWRSEDAGATWSSRAKGMFAEYMPPEGRFDESIQDPHRLAQCPAALDVIWAQHHNGVFRTTNRGVSWDHIKTDPVPDFGFAVAVHPTNADVAWLVPAMKDAFRVPHDARVIVRRTRDGGATWTTLDRGLPAEHAYDLVYRHALDVDASGDALAFGSTTGSLWVSFDQGDSFTAISAHLPPIYSVRFG
jgi:hypothetical protein